MGTCRWASSVIVALPYPALFCCHSRRHSAPHFSALRIASCSQDGDVIVWTQDAAGKWSSVLLNHFSSPVWRVSWSISGFVSLAVTPWVVHSVLTYPTSSSGTYLPSPQATARFLCGSKVPTAFGATSTRSTILIERSGRLLSTLIFH